MNLPDLPLVTWKRAVVAGGIALVQSIGYLSEGMAFWVGALLMGWLIWLLIISVLALGWRGAQRAYQTVRERAV